MKSLNDHIYLRIQPRILYSFCYSYHGVASVMVVEEDLENLAIERHRFEGFGGARFGFLKPLRPSNKYEYYANFV